MLAFRTSTLRSVTKARSSATTRALLFSSSSLKSSSAKASVEPAQSEATIQQAPNRAATWAPSQRPKSEAQVGPRFVQKDLSLQPNPLAAIELIAKEPIRYLDAEAAVCDGDKGDQQGHPRIFIDIDQPGAHACLYCGTRYAHVKYQEELEATSS